MMNEQGEGRFSNLRLNDRLLLQKKTVAYLLLSLLAACILLFVPVLYLDGLMVNVLQVAGFLVLGIIHNRTLTHHTPPLSTSNKVVIALMVAAGILVLLSLAYYFFATYHLLSVLAAVCAFLLPFNITLLWPLFYDISFSEFKPWYFNKDLTVAKSTVFLNSIPIRFKVEGEEERRIAFRAPVRMKLWVIFYHMVQEFNLTTGDTIDLSDDSDNTSGWIFYTNSIAGWRKNLDPESTLVENGIRQNTIIVARRVEGKPLKQNPAAKENN